MLDERLSTIASLVRKGQAVCDIGTDHALLPCYLRRQGQGRIIASDINENPLKMARDTIEKMSARDIELVCSDGLKDIPFIPDCDIIIAGMGGETIAQILSEYDKVTPDQRFILQPMTRHYELRTALYKLGYEIILEKAVNMAHRHYTVIHARYTGQKQETSEVHGYIGKQTDRLYIQSQLDKLRKMSNKDKQLEKVIEEIERSYGCS